MLVACGGRHRVGRGDSCSPPPVPPPSPQVARHARPTRHACRRGGRGIALCGAWAAGHPHGRHASTGARAADGAGFAARFDQTKPHPPCPAPSVRGWIGRRLRPQVLPLQAATATVCICTQAVANTHSAILLLSASRRGWTVWRSRHPSSTAPSRLAAVHSTRSWMRRWRKCSWRTRA